MTITTATPGGNGGSYNPSLSADGTKVAFYSNASNLVGGDTNGQPDVFVKDLGTGKITSVTLGGNGGSYNPSLSADGTKVAFVSNASSLVDGDTNGHIGDVFVKDLGTGKITSVTLGGNGGSASPNLSADGTKVAFYSEASNLVDGDTNGYTPDVFVKDLGTGNLTSVTLGGNDYSYDPSLSADGTKVAFYSNASNLVDGDTNGQIDVFVKDLGAGKITSVTLGGNGGSASPNLSADGTKVAFYSEASNLVDGDTNGQIDVFIKDLETGTITSVTPGGNGGSASPSLSADGTKVAFISFASNLVDGDTNGRPDVFVKDLGTGKITSVTLGEDNHSYDSSLSADGTKVAFFSFASNLVDGDTNGYTPDVLVATLNTLPTLKADPIAMSVYEDASTTNLWNMIVGNGHDVDGDALTISTIDTTGTVGSVIFDKVGKKLVYTADDTIQDLLQPGDTDTTVVKYKLSDGKEDTSEWGTLNIDVKGVPEPNSAGLYTGTCKADVMQGSPTADRMIGAAGNDLMIGTGGDDWMNGGNGKDIFLFGAGFGKDTIVNFDRGQDVIDAREFFGVNNHAAVFNSLDQNGDGTINASDPNVSWGNGRTTVTFDADGVNSLTLVGVQELKVTDFGHAFIA